MNKKQNRKNIKLAIMSFVMFIIIFIFIISCTHYPPDSGEPTPISTSEPTPNITPTPTPGSISVEISNYFEIDTYNNLEPVSITNNGSTILIFVCTLEHYSLTGDYLNTTGGLHGYGTTCVYFSNNIFYAWYIRNSDDYACLEMYNNAGSYIDELIIEGTVQGASVYVYGILIDNDYYFILYNNGTVVQVNSFGAIINTYYTTGNRGLATDGTYFYTLNANSGLITRYSKTFQQIATFKLNNVPNYAGLTYCTSNGYFYTANSSYCFYFVLP